MLIWDPIILFYIIEKNRNKIYECDLHASLGKKGYEIFGHLKKFGALSRDTGARI